jgi:hypothetical protein
MYITHCNSVYQFYFQRVLFMLSGYSPASSQTAPVVTRAGTDLRCRFDSRKNESLNGRYTLRNILIE